MKEKKQGLAERVSYGSIVANCLLSFIKLIAGFVGHSNALVSDAIHSLSDVFSTVIVLIGFRLSKKEEDNDHEYGHERFECMSAVLLSAFLAFTGILIGYHGIMDLVNGTYVEKALPSAITLYAALLSIITKETMFWITRRASLVLKSPSLMADAHHHRSDALSSVGALVGVYLTRHGFAYGEPVASVVICLFILKAAVEIVMDASSKLTDTSCPEEVEEKMRSLILDVPGVKALDTLKTRQFGSKVYVDTEIAVDGSLRLVEAHGIAEEVHDQIEKNFPDVKHCMVHVNPYFDKN